MSSRRYLVVAWLLGTLGLLQMAGDVAGIVPVKAVAAATGASPAPRVFSSVRGLETFSSRFELAWTDRAGERRSLRLTPDRYASLAGPYNRRNAYGASLAYAPVLSDTDRTRAMFDAVIRYALCGKAPLLRELGIDPDDRTGPLVVRLVPREGTRPDAALRLSFDIRCPDAD